MALVLLFSSTLCVVPFAIASTQRQRDSSAVQARNKPYNTKEKELRECILINIKAIATSSRRGRLAVCMQQRQNVLWVLCEQTLRLFIEKFTIRNDLVLIF